ncbi:response regulator transcription factor [Cohnella rhizosphaerae]|uniref:Response regulator n=1 Tax=Cohnella rhizosphaerae TaxID=1457232 RepID=A0A9X4QXH5_9BACL|nr:response regulator [Cohnella rhizosphaerae]MDG0814709.1 response regulator [Cohnella rhizosphaerae]
MQRIMVVDNEPNIVRGIKQMLEEEAPFELDVYGAYSSEEALRLLGQMKIDIALLDIRMPGMNGLELQARIVAQWPQCRVIFLSGYDDFSYIQAALRGGSVDYVLKTDGDEAIIQAIQKALDELNREIESERLIERARQQLQLSIGMLQKDYIYRIASGLSGISQQRLDELNMPLQADRGALPVIARVDGWPASYGDRDKALLDYAIQNIAGEYWAGSRFVAASPDTGTLVALLQADQDEEAGISDGDASLRWIRYVTGQLESIQTACKRYLQLSVSFAAGSSLTPWSGMPVKFAELRQILFFGFGTRTEMLLTDGVSMNFEPHPDANAVALQASSKLRQLLASDLGSESKIRREFEELAELSRQLIHRKAFLYEMYNGIAYMLLSAVNQHAKWNELATDDRLGKLYSLAAHGSWEDALQYLREAIELLLAARDRESEAGAHALVAKLKAYMEGHLDEELSLVKLAEIVYLNPTYLSRLFKQQSGQGVSQYITELRLTRAKDLLRDSKLKIHEIALKVGFDSATSFGRFFKRELNRTPQEYRDEA